MLGNKNPGTVFSLEDAAKIAAGGFEDPEEGYPTGTTFTSDFKPADKKVVQPTIDKFDSVDDDVTADDFRKSDAEIEKEKQEATEAANIAKMQIEGGATQTAGSSLFKTKAQKEADKATKEKAIQAEQAAIAKQAALAREQIARQNRQDEAEKNRAKAQKEADKYTASKVESFRRAGRPVGGFKEGGIASKKPKKKKVMKRGGLASKK